ncbi:DUF2637 domain-containing protein [Micromonospora sp. KC207]|uniref:DUF2637 domain-containing protein n=1 Tax=Micromonospora sp. KC207 TaxID=2530377 RepID=UPI00104B0C3D|nr:DUF2637 domain-containing protein [Micromonospora sp. KC207]TDC63490.1 DUF2637 domain-containing protein [Micromonospora sp. KC207]
MKADTERVEGVVLVLIVLTVGGLAGAASFTHVHDWTMANSPAGTGDWFGWANAAISELLPLAALLTIRRRRRTGGPIGYPLFLLVCAVALSLAAQLAVAKPSLSGWLLSAVPALAFLGLSKLVFSTTPAVPVNQPTDAADWGQWSPDDAGTQDRPSLRLVDDDQAATAEPVPPPPVAVQRPGLVPVPAAAFAPRNGMPYGSERDQ